MRRTLTIILVLVSAVGILAQSIVPVSSVSGTEAVEVRNMRQALVESIARELRFKDPAAAVDLVPKTVSDAAGIADNLLKAARRNQNLVQESNFCDNNFVGENIEFVQTAQLTLNDLMMQIHNRFGVNFIAGPGIIEQPINVKIENIPWNTLLKSQLFVLGIRATCVGDGNTIQLVKNESLPKLQDTAELKTTFVKLKFIQPATQGNVDVAGRSSNRNSGQNQCSQGGGFGGGGGGGFGGGAGGGNQACGNFEKLIIEIEKILGLRQNTSSVGGGSAQGGSQVQQTEAIRTNRSVSVIPGRNILAIRATDDEMELINEIIRRADRAPFQIVVKGLVYTANDNKLRDIGVQTTITTPEGDRTNGGIFGQGISGLGTLFDFSTIIGTTEFNVQASALQQNGVITIKSRPFAAVIDGETVDLDVGQQIPVIISAQNSIGGTPGTLEILEAGNILSVTPQVMDDDNGDPLAVNLTLQLESNEPDTSVSSQGVPAINRRSIQTKLLMNEEQTVILGGFTVDSISRDTTKTPGLGDIPLIGYLFKRKVNRDQLNRLYFAISVKVIKYGEIISPVTVPGATTDVPSINEKFLKNAGDEDLITDLKDPKSKGTDPKKKDNDH